MSRSQPQETPTQSKRLGQDVIMLVLLFVAGFTFLSLHTNATGMAGIYLSRVLKWLLGYAADVAAIFFLVLGLAFGRRGTWPRIRLKSIGAMLAICALLIGIHLVTAPVLGISLSAMKQWWYLGQTPGTGVVGAFLTYWSLRLLGEAGVRLLLVFLVIMSIILVFNVSFIALFRRLWAALGRRQRQTSEQVASRQAGKSVSPATDKPRSRGLGALFRSKGQSRSESPTPRDEVVQGQPAKPSEPTSRRSRPAFDVAAAEDRVSDESKTTKFTASASKVIPLPQRQQLSGTLPSLDLFKDPEGRKKVSQVDQSQLLEDTLASFGVEARVVSMDTGPVITRYEIQPGPGVKVSRITNLADDLALALAAQSVRIEAPVPGKPVVGIEVPNTHRDVVYMKEVLASPEYQNHPSKLALALGKDISGAPLIADLKRCLHLLIAGATGSGKSICLNTIIASLLFRATPEEVRLLMIDPKRVELVNYNGIPHLISPVVQDPKKAATALRWAVGEMERRYELFADTGVRNIDGYNDLARSSDKAGDEQGLEPLPYIVIIVDELADLMLVASNDVEDAICRLAQMARAAGMFLIIATQRPSVDVITGLIKANIPSRIAFAVSSQADSRTILDMSGAEKLLGKGDMLYFPIGAAKATRAQGAWILDQDVNNLVDFWKQQTYEVSEIDVVAETAAAVERAPEPEDELFDDAVRLVVDTGQASVSMLQRRFRIGYSRAARLIDAMELKGIVGEHQGSKPREVLIDSYPEDDQELAIDSADSQDEEESDTAMN